MKWYNRSRSKLQFLTIICKKTPKKSKNGRFWSFGDPHGQPLRPIVQDPEQVVRTITIFNDLRVNVLSFSFFFIFFFFCHFHGFLPEPPFWAFLPPWGPPHGWTHGRIMTDTHTHVGGVQSGPVSDCRQQLSGSFKIFLVKGKFSFFPPFWG